MLICTKFWKIRCKNFPYLVQMHQNLVQSWTLLVERRKFQQIPLFTKWWFFFLLLFITISLKWLSGTFSNKKWIYSLLFTPLFFSSCHYYLIEMYTTRKFWSTRPNEIFRRVDPGSTQTNRKNTALSARKKKVYFIKIKKNQLNFKILIFKYFSANFYFFSDFNSYN